MVSIATNYSNNKNNNNNNSEVLSRAQVEINSNNNCAKR